MFGIENLYTKDDAVKTFGKYKKAKTLARLFYSKEKRKV
jgi:hypothetical protein